MMKVKKFDVLIEKDESGILIASVPQLPGCYSQGKTIREVTKNIKEAIELHLETLKEVQKDEGSQFVTIKKVAVHA